MAVKRLRGEIRAPTMGFVRGFTLFLLATIAAFGQVRPPYPHSGFSTPADGTKVYFTSVLRQKGTDQPFWGKAFVRDEAGLSLFEVRPRVFPPQPIPLTYRLSEPFIIQSTDVSADGSVIAISASIECSGYPCRPIQPIHTTVRSAGRDDPSTYEGTLLLSSNGCWALSYLNLSPQPVRFRLIDLCNGIAYPSFTRDTWFGGRRVVANNGTAVLTWRTNLVIITPDGQKLLPLSGYADGAAIDAEGKTVVMGGNPLRIFAPDTGAVRDLEGIRGRNPQISDDGQRILYRSVHDSNELRVVHSDGSGDRPLARLETGLVDFVLAGNGEIAFAATREGQIYRIDVTTEAREEWITRSPYLRPDRSPGAAPKLLARFTGYGLAAQKEYAETPLPDALQGLRIRVGGRPLRMISAGPNFVWAVHPPDIAPLDPNAIQLRALVEYVSDSAEYFDAGEYETSFNQRELLPGNLLPLFAHGDFRGPVSEQDPAEPGEVLHFYTTGLGSTTPSVPYDEPAPAGTMARSPLRLRCNDPAVEVLFLGLAPAEPGQVDLLTRMLDLPTTAGLYRMDLRVPKTAQGSYTFSCRIDNSVTYVSGELFMRVPIHVP
ncbi:MAG: hypothetical protein JNL98_05205 [Bryobacterales bacterium]|nr:hypothetical protein [Bryobacterales bacterium]